MSGTPEQFADSRKRARLLVFMMWSLSSAFLVAYLVTRQVLWITGIAATAAVVYPLLLVVLRCPQCSAYVGRLPTKLCLKCGARLFHAEGGG